MPDVLNRDLERMVQEGVITPESANRVRDWYARKNAFNPNRPIFILDFLVFVLLFFSGILSY